MEKVFQVVHDFSLIFTYMVAITAMSRVFVAYRFRNRINKDGVKVINNIGSYYGVISQIHIPRSERKNAVYLIPKTKKWR